MHNMMAAHTKLCVSTPSCTARALLALEIHFHSLPGLFQCCKDREAPKPSFHTSLELGFQLQCRCAGELNLHV